MNRGCRFCGAVALGVLLSLPAIALVPRVVADGPALAFDFPGVEVGVAEYEEGPTGVTVLHFPKRVMAAIDVRGGSPGTVNSDIVRLPHDEAFVSAIAIAGGSAYGLSAITGIADALKESTDNPGDWRNVAVVSGAIIFDLGDRRYNAVTPDAALGRAALQAAHAGSVPLGARGAGRFAMQGAYLGDRQNSGQGAALRQAGPVKVLVVTVVNAAGTIVDRNGQMLRCSRPRSNGACGSIAEKLDQHLADAGALKPGKIALSSSDGPTANTTVTVVVTNQTLPFSALQRLAVQVHNSMARAIQPFGMLVDGDTLFAVSTGEVQNSALSSLDLSTLASETAWDAVLASAPAPAVRTAAGGSAAQAPDVSGYVGRYEFTPGVVAEISSRGGSLQIIGSGRDSLYLPTGKAIALVPAAGDDFTLDTPRADRLRFERDKRKQVLGLTIDPGQWPIPARRLPK